MSKTMTTTKLSLIELTQSIQLKDTITFQINSESLNKNFYMIKQCLLKVEDLQNDMGKQKANNETFMKKLIELQDKVKQNQKLQIQQDNKIKQLSNNVGDDFMKKLYDMQTKIKNTYDFDQTVRRLEQMNKFVLMSEYNEQEKNISEISNDILKLKQQLSRYVQNISFQQYKQAQQLEIESIKKQISLLNSNNNEIKQSIVIVQKNCSQACIEVKQNSKMLKEMNFNELFDKIKKIKEDNDHKVGQLSIKLKKKCAIIDLNQLETKLVQKLDKFFAMNQKGKASINQTRQALLYLQKRLNQVYQILVAKQSEDQNDALFSTKKAQCASCTKDLGKYQGKLGQFKPWAIFPCKQLDPEKTGGYGYLTYVDKMHYRRGSVADDSSLDRLSKTFYDRNREQESPSKKVNTARTTNFMSSFGQEAKQIISLKEQYFKDLKNDKVSNKFFRVKKDIKPSTAVEPVKEKAKEI